MDWFGVPPKFNLTPVDAAAGATDAIVVVLPKPNPVWGCWVPNWLGAAVSPDCVWVAGGTIPVGGCGLGAAMDVPPPNENPDVTIYISKAGG